MHPPQTVWHSGGWRGRIWAPQTDGLKTVFTCVCFIEIEEPELLDVYSLGTSVT